MRILKMTNRVFPKTKQVPLLRKCHKKEYTPPEVSLKTSLGHASDYIAKCSEPNSAQLIDYEVSNIELLDGGDILLSGRTDEALFGDVVNRNGIPILHIETTFKQLNEAFSEAFKKTLDSRESVVRASDIIRGMYRDSISRICGKPFSKLNARTIRRFHAN